MKIRSITYLTNPGWPIDKSTLDKAKVFISLARSSFELGGYEIQTTRLATPPFPWLLPNCRTNLVIEFAQELEDAIPNVGFDYLSIGPGVPDIPDSYMAIPEVIAATEKTFAGGSDRPDHRIFGVFRGGKRYPGVELHRGVGSGTQRS